MNYHEFQMISVITEKYPIKKRQHNSSIVDISIVMA